MRTLACGANPGNRMAQSTHHRRYQAFLRLLRSWRDDAGLTQVELGDRLGVTQTFISKVERGERRLDIVEFAEWCEALRLAPEDAWNRFLQTKVRGTDRKLTTRRRA